MFLFWLTWLRVHCHWQWCDFDKRGSVSANWRQRALATLHRNEMAICVADAKISQFVCQLHRWKFQLDFQFDCIFSQSASQWSGISDFCIFLSFSEVHSHHRKPNSIRTHPNPNRVDCQIVPPFGVTVLQITAPCCSCVCEAARASVSVLVHFLWV